MIDEYSGTSLRPRVEALQVGAKIVNTAQVLDHHSFDSQVIPPDLVHQLGQLEIDPVPERSGLQFWHPGEFDLVVAMTHDHGLIPVKYLGVEQGVNVTLGLPFVRTSPDHGTAFDIAGTGRADAASLHAALAMATRLSAADASGA